MTMPVMEPDLNATVLENWARGIDEGPFSSSPASGRCPQCWGERIAFETPDNLTLLGALAAWTSRVRLLTTVIVPQLHDPVMLAKYRTTAVTASPRPRASSRSSSDGGAEPAHVAG
jgi:hypothetical protein